MRKRLISLLLCFVICAALLPVSAQAVETAVATPSEILTEGDVWDGSITQPTMLVQKDDVYYYEISKCSELAYVAQTGGEWLEYNYILGNNLILNDVTLTWDNEGNLSTTESLLVWQPIGEESNYFRGIFNGNNFSISGLYSVSNGLFDSVYEGTVCNINITNAYISNKSHDYTGGVVGFIYHGDCYNCSYNGVVIGHDDLCTGGICGDAVGTVVESCSFKGTVLGGTQVGGIVGTGVGSLFDLSNCYVSAQIVGADNVGGIVGEMLSGDIETSAFVGEITSTGTCCGGIVGSSSKGTISNSYCIATLNGASNVGGITGECDKAIENCYSASKVIGTSNLGGIVGKDNGMWGGNTTYKNCYYLKYVGYNEAIFGKGLSTEDNAQETTAITLDQINKQSTFENWDFTNVWAISADVNGGYPYLKWQENILTDVSVSGISLSSSNLSLSVGDFSYLSATVSPTNASNQAFTWKSSDPSIATVTVAGKVTAVSPGTAIITATTKNGGYTASCTVTVTERMPEEYKINSITIRDNAGEALSSIPSGSFLATVSITNLASEGNSLVFLASYTSTGQYQGMMWVSVEDLPVGATIKVTLPVDNATGEIKNLKAFTAASFSNLTPLGAVASFFP